MAGATLGGWLVHVMRKADGALSMEESLHVIMDSMKDYFPCQSVAVLLIDEGTGELRIKISRQISYTFVKQFRKEGPGATAEQVILEQKPLLLNDLPEDSDVYTQLKLEHDFSSAVIAPVVKNQRGVGYIFCDRANHEQLRESDLLHLQVIGLLIGSLMRKFELIRQGKQLSQIDDATGVLQYKAFIPAFGTELDRAATHDYETALALVSVDAFRQYVETHGIDAAHALLAEVATIIKENIRDMDILARFGADEFILCLSGVTTEEAKDQFSTILNAVTENAIGQGDSIIRITVGALALQTEEQMKRPLQDILGAVGKSLVDAKGQGGGCVELASLT